MARIKIHVGLEIGTSKVCMIAGECHADGSVRILGLGNTKSVGVKKGEICDFHHVKDCVNEALVKAEDASDVEIGSVFLSVTGSHISSVNNTGTFRLPENEKQIQPEHVEEVKDIARDVHISPDHVHIHSILKNYRVDGFEHTTNPLGLFGKTIEADYHIVSGLTTRIQNSIKCVRELHLEVDDVVFSPIAAAQLALGKRERERGALLIDIGGGTTEYALYINGVITASGCIAVGGDHITNDIHLLTNLSFSKAEQIKIKEGDVSGDSSSYIGSVKVSVDEKGFAQQEVKRELLNEVIRQRMIEILRLVYKRLPANSLEQIGTGIYLSGGTSMLRGFDTLTNQVFGKDIYRAEAADISGVQANFKDPQFATALGLIRYAQILDIEKENTSKRILPKWLWPFGR